MASLLTRMEKCSLLERRTHEDDRRAHRVSILADGRQYYQELLAIAIDLQEAILEAVPLKRREQFLLDLERVGDACQNQVNAETSRQKGLGKKRKNDTV